MPSLTPQHRAEETAEHAFRDGMLSGLLALVPSSAAVYAAMQNKQFVRSTNWQSRTALIISECIFQASGSVLDLCKYERFQRIVYHTCSPPCAKLHV